MGSSVILGPPVPIRLLIESSIFVFESDKAFGPSRSPWALLAQVIDLWILRQDHLQIFQILCIEMNTPRIDAQDLDSEATMATQA